MKVSVRPRVFALAGGGKSGGKPPHSKGKTSGAGTSRARGAAFAGEGVGGPAGWAGEGCTGGGFRVNGFTFGGLTVKKRRELAGGQGVQGAEACGEFDGSQAALAIEPAEEIASGPLTFLRVAFDAAGDEVAVGIAPQLDTRHDMVEALERRGKPAQTVKAEATLAGVDGHAKCPGSQEIGVLEIDGASLSVRRAGGVARPGAIEAGGVNLLGQAHLDQVTGLAAFDQA